MLGVCMWAYNVFVRATGKRESFGMGIWCCCEAFQNAFDVELISELFICE